MSECCLLEDEGCRLERCYRRTRHVDDRRLWVVAVRDLLRLYREKKEAYWLDRLSQSGHSTPQLWRSLTTMLSRDRDTSGATGHIADQFASFFAREVDDVRTSTAGRPSPPVFDSASTSLSFFSRHKCGVLLCRHRQWINDV